MATLLEQFTLWADGPSGQSDAARELYRRVIAAVQAAAVAILAESEATENHEARLAWAQEALRNYASVIGPIWAGVTANETIADKHVAEEEITDGDIEFTVNSLITGIAV